ncbi:hypothetical protein LCGC14_0489970 [marine sediment metagenome]|uniref:Uncharacterized protein n=1 Tax=marine sediment metagenome TaxID=412755 RepID=A0A0F9SC50_9ZZZZ|nr:hypothetical protein [Phycisphaerae bacterium]
MAVEYSPQTVADLTAAFGQTGIVRPMRIGRYEAGRELTFDITGVAPARPARMRVRIERFVGGGYAGQVYRVKLLELDAPEGPISGLAVGDCYALKILLPPRASSARFRDALYAVGFQAPFSLQSNPAAARAGALWQTLIRRAARLKLGSERAVTEIHATFVDSALGSCGEISEWIDGRVWRFETDDHFGRRRHWKVGQPRDGFGSPEYLAKRQFMADVVDLLHEMGAPELARQYEWWTCKSQPNCLKRHDGGDDPAAGLTAVDFRAGLALLPFLPMSPADVWLIAKGIGRGSLVQFDRGNLTKLKGFIEAHHEHFSDMADVVAELETAERRYRDSQIDITHNFPRLAYSPRLWGTILAGAVDSWRIRNVIDEPTADVLHKNRFAAALFGLLGTLAPASLIAGLVVLVSCLFRWRITAAEGIAGVALVTVGPAVVRLLRALMGRADVRHHYGRIVTQGLYLRKAFRAHVYEALIGWHRAGRLDERHTERVKRHVWLYLIHRPLSVLPAGLHRFLTDGRYVLGVLHFILIRPVKLVLNADLRETWMREMLAEGLRRRIISDDEADQIDKHIPDPFVQKYLKALAVHVCTLPISQVVALIAAMIYSWSMGLHFWYDFWKVWGIALAFIATVQVVPISPGSLVRGLYVLYLVIRERNFKDYNIAVFLAFFKYIGYLAFPIQMANRYPVLSRFMAGHWATGAARMVPVFGEHGALLEHGVFDLFFNYSLTLRRRIRVRVKQRKALPQRHWHFVPIALAAGAIYAAISWVYVRQGFVPAQRHIWYATLVVPLIAGWVTARWAGGAPPARRVVLGAFTGLLAGLLAGGAYVFFLAHLQAGADQAVDMSTLVKPAVAATVWRLFTFGILATVGALICENIVPEPSPSASLAH